MKRPRLLLLLLCVLAAGHAAGQETASARLESEALQHLTEGRGHARAKLYRRAIGDLQVAIAMAERISDTNLTLALALHNLGEVYRLQGEPANALAAYRRALRIYEALDYGYAVTIVQNQVRTFLPNAEEMTSTGGARSKPAPPAAKRLTQINKAVERIRKRLQSTAPTPPPISHAAADSIRLSEVQGSSLAPKRRLYAEAVRDKIQRGWRYPASSRNKHQEGTVELEFALLGSGEIDSINVVKSSGFLPLDMESIRSVREAAPFGPVTLLPGESQISMRLLFDYVLPTPDRGPFKAQAPQGPLADQ